ncbi:hypothetical protein [Pontivivens insulae]|uniref:Glycosyltransferase RgtA/B/C/D-like domain-containing protein n=1 Tax=Pontivivens insulae TaxID=1639689 RepID=A0A2R8A6Q2_9RHOB|nr:hypothetical protein [Pontivivens insulae]RED18016.1 hypothetical protein DFR53_0205 [Pontivivens insulae]SPF27909.1 hypothetical protein POI8812_00204 [Pontivivens insulae]
MSFLGLGDKQQLTAQQEQVMAERRWHIIAVILAIVSALVLSAPNLVDPMIRHDDYPALFTDAEIFWPKTLHEGRWLNYVWHLRPVITPAWFNFAVYQTLWAVLAVTIALQATRNESDRVFVAALTLLIISSSLSTLISLWFNTLLPGLAVLTLYGVLGHALSQRTYRRLLPLFVVVSFSAYTTYPLILLALCIAQTDQRSLKDLLWLLCLFVASFALAIFAAYTLNWAVHGVFGVPLDTWRDASGADDLAGMINNLPLLIEVFEEFIVKASYGFKSLGYLHLLILVSASVVLLRVRPMEALYLLAGLGAGLGLIGLLVLKAGVITPPRAFIFAWIFYGIIVVRAALALKQQSAIGGRIARVLVLLMSCFYAMVTVKQYASYGAWQVQTRLIARQLDEIDPSGERTLLISGDVLTLNSAQAAHLQSPDAMASRMKQISGREVILCDEAPASCEQLETLAASGEILEPVRLDIASELSP